MCNDFPFSFFLIFRYRHQSSSSSSSRSSYQPSVSRSPPRRRRYSYSSSRSGSWSRSRSRSRSPQRRDQWSKGRQLYRYSTVTSLGSCFICALHILWETLKWRVKASSFLLQSLISAQLWSCSKAKCGRGEETQGESHCKLIILGIIKWNDSSSYDVKLMDSLPGGAPRCLRW